MGSCRLISRKLLTRLTVMSVDPVFERAFSRVYGKPCWRVSPGYASCLTLEFGKPHLMVREPLSVKGVSALVRAAFAQRRVTIRGDWHLWIYCCDWEVVSRGRRIGDSSTESRTRQAAKSIDGQKLTKFSISPKTLECSFYFDLGAIMTTRPFDKKSEQWLFYEPSNKVLTLRADGYYKHSRSDRADGRGKWNAIVLQ